jgi:hypothetical protein
MSTKYKAIWFIHQVGAKGNDASSRDLRKEQSSAGPSPLCQDSMYIRRQEEFTVLEKKIERGVKTHPTPRSVKFY